VAKRENRAKRLDINYSTFIINEAYRTARTNLLFLLSTSSYKKISVTSGLPAEGKSTTCINLSISFAKVNKKVLLIDGDMRNPVIHRNFDLRVSPGLSDVLIGFKELSKCIYETNVENLSIIPAGTIPPNPADLLTLPKFQETMDELSTKFDYIFFDTPPVNLYTDALSIANKMDGTILVTKYNWTKRDLLESTIEKFNKIDARLFGVILNNYDNKKFIQHMNYGKRGDYDLDNK
jgi:capsular exopolysaccharide synthesis family protein